jgi:hypothetical protein
MIAVRAALFAMFTIMLAACAQVAEVTGGPKDETAPELLAAEPAHLSTNFQGDRVELLFSERITLERVRDRLLISPPLNVQPDVRLTGSQSVLIAFKEKLKPNTTYVIGIGEAVKDLTEGNTAAGVVHVFSTGAYLDTAVIAGVVTNAFTGVPEADVTVLVHFAEDTSTFTTSRPAYATRSDAQGRFLLKHLPSKSFRLFALRDKNANYRYDLPNEEIAFLDSVVEAVPLDTTLRSFPLRLFKERSAKQQIRSSNVTADGAFRLVLERAVSNVEVQDVIREGGRLKWDPEFNADRDTVLLWPSDTTALGSGRYKIIADGEALDTLAYRPIEKMPFFITVKTALREGPDPFIEARTSRPIASFDTSRMILLKDSVRSSMDVTKNALRTLRLNADIDPGEQVQLILLPKAITDLHGGHNDTVKVSLGRAGEQSTGIVRVKVMMFEPSAGPYILQMVDKQGNILNEEVLADLSTTVVWERIQPGEIRLRLMEDRNENGRWDTGSLQQRLQPENVWVYSQPINVRAAWDIGVDWEIGTRPIGGDPGREP